MKSLQQSLKKAFFLFNVLVLGIVIVFVELLFLSKSDKGQVLGVSDNNPIRVLIGQAEKNRENEMVISLEVIKTNDARPKIIKSYLEKYNSPLVPYSDLIYEVSQDYGFEYYWIVAIAQQESNLCKKVPENSHNCWGYGIHKRGTLRFQSYELAIRSYAEYLKREYFDKGLDTPELIMKKYTPSSNGSWARGVWQFINEMENGDF